MKRIIGRCRGCSKFVVFNKGEYCSDACRDWVQCNSEMSNYTARLHSDRRHRTQSESKPRKYATTHNQLATPPPPYPRNRSCSIGASTAPILKVNPEIGDVPSRRRSPRPRESKEGHTYRPHPSDAAAPTRRHLPCRGLYDANLQPFTGRFEPPYNYVPSDAARRHMRIATDGPHPNLSTASLLHGMPSMANAGPSFAQASGGAPAPVPALSYVTAPAPPTTRTHTYDSSSRRYAPTTSHHRAQTSYQHQPSRVRTQSTAAPVVTSSSHVPAYRMPTSFTTHAPVSSSPREPLPSSSYYMRATPSSRPLATTSPSSRPATIEPSNALGLGLRSPSGDNATMAPHLSRGVENNWYARTPTRARAPRPRSNSFGGSANMRGYII